MMVEVHFMMVKVYFMMVKGGSFYEGLFLPMSTFGLLRHIPGAFMDRHFVHVAKWREQTRQEGFYDNVLPVSLVHVIAWKGEKQNLRLHICNHRMLQLRITALRIQRRQTSIPQPRTAPQRMHLKQASKSTWRCLILSHLPGKNRLHTPARGNELALYLVETKHRIMSEIRGHMHSFA